MSVQVKAFVPQGEAVQVIFEGPHPSARILVPKNAPAWFIDWVMQARQNGDVERFGFIPLPGARDNHWMTGVISGWWLVRGVDGQLIGIPPEQFDWFYQRETKGGTE